MCCNFIQPHTHSEHKIPSMLAHAVRSRSAVRVRSLLGVALLVALNWQPVHSKQSEAAAAAAAEEMARQQVLRLVHEHDDAADGCELTDGM